MLTLAACIQSWKNWLSEATSTFDCRVVPTRAKPVSSLPHPCSCHITTNSPPLSSIVCLCSQTEQLRVTVHIQAHSMDAQKALCSCSWSGGNTHSTPDKWNWTQTLLFLGTSFKLTQSDKVHRRLIYGKIEHGSSYSLDNCLFAKMYVFMKLGCCLSVCAQQSLSKCIKHRLEFIWRCHNIISIIYPFTSCPNEDKMTCHQKYGFLPWLDHFCWQVCHLLLQINSRVLFCAVSITAIKNKSKGCHVAATCLCGHLDYKSMVGCLWGGRKSLNCHNFQRKANISGPDTRFLIWHSELQLLNPWVCILCPFCAFSDWTL